jgi:hypothetical protein
MIHHRQYFPSSQSRDPILPDTSPQLCLFQDLGSTVLAGRSVSLEFCVQEVSSGAGPEVSMTSFAAKVAAVLCCFCSAISATAWPRKARSLSKIQATSERQTAQLQSVSGRIRSVEGNTFTLETIESHASTDQEQEQKVMMFTVDQDTAIEGRIEVSSNADVTYRKADGHNIAVSIRVTPQS